MVCNCLRLLAKKPWRFLFFTVVSRRRIGWFFHGVLESTLWAASGSQPRLLHFLFFRIFFLIFMALFFGRALLHLKRVAIVFVCFPPALAQLPFACFFIAHFEWFAIVLVFCHKTSGVFCFSPLSVSGGQGGVCMVFNTRCCPRFTAELAFFFLLCVSVFLSCLLCF